MSTKENIKSLRTRLGMTQMELSIACGLGQSTIAGYETGFRKPCIQTAKLLIKLAFEHGIDIDLDFLLM